MRPTLPCYAAAAAKTRPKSGLQKEVMDLYRRGLRNVKTKPEVRGQRVETLQSLSDPNFALPGRPTRLSASPPTHLSLSATITASLLGH